MIAVLGSFRFPAGSIEQARPLMQAVIAATLIERGCRAYSYAEDVAEPGLFRVTELWDDHEALDAHFETPHMKQWMDERARLGFSNRVIASYEVGPAKPL